jgi:hypothetical protein
LIYFESITQKVLISPSFFLYFFKDGRAVTFVGASIAQVFPLTLGESQAEREKKLSGKGIKVLDFPGCVDYILV